MSQIRQFATGATRDTDADKLDLEGFLSPLVIERFGEYMHKKRRLPNGDMRESDNWQLGIPQTQYVKSAHRHFLDWWKAHRGYATRSGDDIEDEICALIFNAQGYLHELLKGRAPAVTERSFLPHWDPKWGHPTADACARHNINPMDAMATHAQSVLHSHPMASEALREQDFA